MSTFPVEHEPFLVAALRAPSAHNAQPWRLVPVADDSYELHYDHHDYLPHDPDDRDAYLAMGAFYETLALVAQPHGFRCSFSPRFERCDSDLFVGVVTVSRCEPGFTPDPLAYAIGDRVTNRHPYERESLPPDLEGALVDLGCSFTDPRAAARIVRTASSLAWRDRQFVIDLRRWMRFSDDDAPDGMTPDVLTLTAIDTFALRFALWRGKLRRPASRLYARRDAVLTRASATVAVLRADSLTPESLFDAGRRLLRAWTMINAAGYSYHPLSIAIDRRETAPRVAELAGVSHPVAMFRVGYTDQRALRSNRRSLNAVLGRGAVVV
jgi:hypothetical protein